MGQISERTELLRILLADEDDANAFLFQCGINRLARACAFQRVAKQSQISEKLQTFRPNLLVAVGGFAHPEVLREIKKLTNGHPIICAVENCAEGEAAMEAGADDCVLVSQVDDLHECIERHLNGGNETPYFKKDLSESTADKPSAGPSKVDLKLQEFDRRVGALLKRGAAAANLKFRKLARVSSVACAAAERQLRRRYRALRVQWLLHKQKRLVQSSVANVRPAEAGFIDLGIGSQTEGSRGSEFERDGSKKTELTKIRIVATEGRGAAHQPEFASEEGKGEPGRNDALRTLELSFKTLFHAALDPMFLLDGLGCFLHVNTAGCALLGARAADLLGKSILEFVPANERAQVSAMWEALLVEGQQKAEMHLQAAEGKTREVYVSARTNLWFGVHLLVVRDQTEVKSLRAALEAQAGKITTPPPDLSAPGSLAAGSRPAP